MNWRIFLLLALANGAVFAKDFKSLRTFLELIKRRLEDKEAPVLIVAQASSELPETAPSPPGHTLLKPAQDTLQSAAKYPLKDVSGSLVYGNLDNLGITYDKTNQRILYSGFRRNTDVAIISRDKNHNRVVKILDEEQHPSSNSDGGKNDENEENSAAANSAREIFNIVEESSDKMNADYVETRRRDRKKRHRDRKDQYFTDDDSEASKSSDSDDDEKNPDNPYTVHKNRYKQNWLWNFAMTGDHMNVNPKAPQFNHVGPSGGDIFFARKWWYFNQDDYIQFR